MIKSILKKIGFHVHDWSKWEKIGSGNILNSLNNKQIIGSWIDQERTCQSCNKIEINTITNYLKNY
jgi:hypothetical protein